MVKIIILCGGSGSRLWPLSRKEKPKQFMKLPNAKYNLFQDTMLRIEKLEANCSELIIVSNNNIRTNTIESVQRLDLKCKVTYIWEPLMRNTGPAIGTVIAYLGDSDEDCIVWPSDHILCMDTFNKSIHEAKQYLKDSIITFGIKPTYPETGYGYITATTDNKIDKFIEKPHYEVAKELITNPNCYWNSGIFYFRPDILIREYINQDPIMFDHIRKSIKKNDTNNTDIDAEMYARCENIAFDKLIMERTSTGRVIQFNGNWSDIGSWDALSKVYTNNNTDHTLQLDNKNCHIFNYNDNQLISTIGLKDICIVNTPDALLIADLGQTQKVKTIYQQLDNAKSMYVQKHTKNDYPWGITEELTTNDTGIHISKFAVNENFNFIEHLQNAPFYYIIPIHGIGMLEVAGQQIPLEIHNKIIIQTNNTYRITNMSTNEKLVFIEFRVTGGAGFIGSNIVEFLLENNVQFVRVLDNLSTGCLANIESFTKLYTNIEFMWGDITNLDTCVKACAGISVICHQAALESIPQSVDDPLTSHNVNVNGFVNIILAAKQTGIKRIVYASSSAVYGDSPGTIKYESEISTPLSPYGTTKYINEIYAEIFTKLYGMECIGLRYFNVFGPRQNPNGLYAAVIPKFIKHIIHNQRPVINGDGTYSRDFIYVDNVVYANYLAITTNHIECFGQIFNLGTNDSLTIADLFIQIKNILGRTKMEPIYGHPRPADVPHCTASIDKIGSMLEYKPITNFYEGLVKTIEYFNQQKFMTMCRGTD